VAADLSNSLKPAFGTYAGASFSVFGAIAPSTPICPAKNSALQPSETHTPWSS